MRICQKMTARVIYQLTFYSQVAKLFDRHSYDLHTARWALRNHGLRGSTSPVLTATGFVNGRWQFSTPHRINTPWPITKTFGTGDLGICAEVTLKGCRTLSTVGVTSELERKFSCKRKNIQRWLCAIEHVSCIRKINSYNKKLTVFKWTQKYIFYTQKSLKYGSYSILTIFIRPAHSRETQTDRQSKCN